MEEPSEPIDPLAQFVYDELQKIDQVPDLTTRAGMASSLVHRLSVVTGWVTTSRAHMLAEMRARGMGAAEVGRVLGVTRQAAHRLLREATGQCPPES